MTGRFRPLGVTLVILLVLTIAIINLIRLVQAIRQWAFLTDLLSGFPLYMALSGLAWGILGAAAGFALWRGYRWAPALTWIFAIVYTIYYWIDRLLLSAAARSTNRPFAAAVNIILIVLLWWILSRSGVKEYFGEAHESKSQDTEVA